MRLATTAFAFAVAALAVAPAAVYAQATGRGVPTVTRLVKIFTELETTLAANAHASDASALDSMLEPAFEMRVGDAPGTPVPRDEWLRRVRAAPNTTPRFAQMAVHDFGDLAIVSFGDTTTPTRFVVDAWKREGDAWKLAVRYQSDVTPPRTTSPTPDIPKKY